MASGAVNHSGVALALGDGTFGLSLEAIRRDGTDDDAREHSIGLRAIARW